MRGIAAPIPADCRNYFLGVGDGGIDIAPPPVHVAIAIGAYVGQHGPDEALAAAEGVTDVFPVANAGAVAEVFDDDREALPLLPVGGQVESMRDFGSGVGRQGLQHHLAWRRFTGSDGRVLQVRRERHHVRRR